MKVKFVPQNIELEIEPNQTIMDLAHKNDVFIKSVCNGLPNCAECRIYLVEGEHNVSPPSQKELSLIGTGHHIDRRRLSCQTICFGDVVVDLSEQVEKSKVNYRRPQGAHQKEEIGDSKAVVGNLIEQEGDLLKKIVETEGQRPARGEQKKSRPNNRRTNRKRNARSQSARSENPRSQSARSENPRSQSARSENPRSQSTRSENPRSQSTRSRNTKSQNPGSQSTRSQNPRSQNSSKK